MPSHVKGVVVVDVAPVSYPSFDKFIEYIDTMKALPLHSLTSRKEADDWMKPYFPDYALRQFLLTNLVHDKSTGKFRWKIHLDGLRANLPQLRSFPVDPSKIYHGPTLFLAGEHSDYIRPGDEGVMRWLFPKSTLVTVPNSGHWLHADQPKLFVEIVGKFLMSHNT
jgi:pimeloyl-ACP methyl ester carboxylesterase